MGWRGRVRLKIQKKGEESEKPCTRFYLGVTGAWLSQKDKVGTLGDTGNAKGKQPHVHYSILSLIPLPWKATSEPQGWKKMFFLNPHEKLL